MEKFLKVFIIVFCLFSLAGCDEKKEDLNVAVSIPSIAADDQKIAQAFQNRTSGIVVESSGTVERILSDDVEGSRHQRFILRLATGQTLLMTHNIDLAPRVENLQVGDTVHFSGQYEWNEKGGVIHWTHHDPAGHRPGGWLMHQGRLIK